MQPESSHAIKTSWCHNAMQCNARQGEQAKEQGVTQIIVAASETTTTNDNSPTDYRKNEKVVNDKKVCKHARLELHLYTLYNWR